MINVESVASRTTSARATGTLASPLKLDKICPRCSSTILSPDNWNCRACLYQPEKTSGILTFCPEFAEPDECYATEIIDELAELEATNFWFKSRNRLITWALGRYFPGFSNFFEVGCGTGYVIQGIAQQFPNAEIFGCDALPQCLTYALKRVPNAQLYQMDARNIPIRSSFDVAGAFDVIEHVKEDKAVLREIHKSLRPGGGLMVSCPQHMWLWSKCDDFVKHERRYEQGELAATISECGFDVVRVVPFVSLLLPVLVASRIWQHISPKPYTLVSELKVQGTAGGILEKVLDCERFLVQEDVPLPLAASALVIAVKR